ncbi:MAG: DUF2937 family protein [Rhodospirillaceae bacterium]
MGWLLQKIDMLIGASLAAIAGMGASQIQAFIDQYVQRLGGHLDEAKLNLDRIETGVRYQTMSDTVRRELETDAKLRVSELQSGYDAITTSDVITRPFTFFQHADEAIMAGTWTDFVPAVPLDINAFVYIGLGIVCTLIIYEIVKFPLVLIFSQPRKRKFRKRGAAV